jgi:hypothetical protein
MTTARPRLYPLHSLDAQVLRTDIVKFKFKYVLILSWLTVTLRIQTQWAAEVSSSLLRVGRKMNILRRRQT